MSITFEQIPSNTRIPGRYAELNTRLAARGLPASDAVVVILGQKTASGTATAGEMVQVLSDAEAGELFGQGSHLHRMVLAALEANRYMAELHCVPLADDGAGVAAAGSITFAVASLEAGTLTVYIGDDAVEVTVEAADTAAEIATALVAAIGDLPELPISAAVNGGVPEKVDITAKNKGLLGNQLGIETEYSGTGLTRTIVAMTGGLTDPDAQDALDAIFAANVDAVVFPWNNATDLGELVTHLDSVSDGVEQRGCVGVTAHDTTVSAATTITTGLNSGRVTFGLLEGTRTWSIELAAAYAAVIAGEPDLARPLNGVDLPGVHAPAQASRFTRAELTTLLANGVTPFQVGPTGKVEVVRSITTYVEDENGAADATLLDLQTIRILDYVRKALKTRLDDRFSQVKIADVAHTENATDTTKIRAEILDVLYACEAIDYLEAVEDNQDDVVVERNESDRSRVDCQIPADVVNGLHVLAQRIDLIL